LETSREDFSWDFGDGRGEVTTYGGDSGSRDGREKWESGRDGRGGWRGGGKMEKSRFYEFVGRET